MPRPHPPYVHSLLLTGEVRNLGVWHREEKKGSSLGWSCRWDMTCFMRKKHSRWVRWEGLSGGLKRWHENARLIPKSWRNKFFRSQGHSHRTRPDWGGNPRLLPAKLSNTGTTLICWAVKRVLYVPDFGKQGRFIRNAAFPRASWVLWESHSSTHLSICSLMPTVRQTLWWMLRQTVLEFCKCQGETITTQFSAHHTEQWQGQSCTT